MSSIFFRQLIKDAIDSQNVGLIDITYESLMIDYDYDDSFLLRYAVKNNYYHIVKYYLDYVDPSVKDNKALCTASAFGYYKIVQLLLNDERLNLMNSDALIKAVKNGHVKIVQLLLSDLRIDPTWRNNLAIRLAVRYDHHEVVRLLMNEYDVDPSSMNNACLMEAVYHYRPEMVRLLLTDPRVHTFARDHHIFIKIAECGYDDLAKLFLSDCALNPSANDNAALQWAMYNSHISIVEMIINDWRFTITKDRYVTFMNEEMYCQDIKDLLKKYFSLINFEKKKYSFLNEVTPIIKKYQPDFVAVHSNDDAVLIHF